MLYLPGSSRSWEIRSGRLCRDDRDGDGPPVRLALTRTPSIGPSASDLTTPVKALVDCSKERRAKQAANHCTDRPNDSSLHAKLSITRIPLRISRRAGTARCARPARNPGSQMSAGAKLLFSTNPMAPLSKSWPDDFPRPENRRGGLLTSTLPDVYTDARIKYLRNSPFCGLKRVNEISAHCSRPHPSLFVWGNVVRAIPGDRMDHSCNFPVCVSSMPILLPKDSPNHQTVPGIHMHSPGPCIRSRNRIYLCFSCFHFDFGDRPHYRYRRRIRCHASPHSCRIRCVRRSVNGKIQPRGNLS